MPTTEEINQQQTQLFYDMTQLEQKFVLALMSGMTQHEAYKKANPNLKQNNPDVIRTAASKLRHRERVVAFMETRKRLEQEKLKNLMLDVDEMRTELISKLYYQATMDITDIIEFGEVDGQTIWRIKNSDELSSKAKACIESVERTSQGFKLKVASRTQAAKTLGDWLGWNAPSKTEITGAELTPWSEIVTGVDE